ncbi:hypothetical protein ACFWEK_20970, partial [Isoptericola sp. NPDC060257]
MPSLPRPLRRRARSRRASAAGARGVGAVALTALLALSGCGLLGDGGSPDDDVSATGENGSGVGVRGTTEAPTAEPGTGDASALPTFDPDTTVGGYADGFPEKLLGAPEDATVLASSATPGEGGLTDVTLNLATQRGTQDVIDQLAKRLRKAGFEESGTSS